MSKVNNVIIVGGGTSGWLSCAYFLIHKPNVNITIIESDDIPPIGVGEGSWPNISKILNPLNINYEDINFTKKSGINYVDWYSNQSSPYNNWYHPFLKKNAIHFEVGKLIPILKNKCIEMGAIHIQDEVIKCNMFDNGFMKSVVLKNGEEQYADLFIDCTGFNRKLISNINPLYVDASNEIICDSAITAHIKKQNKESDMLWTKATALSSGWTWEIPLHDKTGVGYVYSSKFTTAKLAEKEFSEYLGYEDIEFKHINWNSGFLKTPYLNNCLAVGLSAGFLEPLEATSIGITVKQLMWLNKYIYFPDKYNSKVEFLFKHYRDYILSHYLLNNRSDSEFWDYTKNLPISRELQILFNESHIYCAHSWKCMFDGMNYSNK